MRDIILLGSSREVAFFNSGSKSGEEHRFINFETEEPIMANVTLCTIKNMQYLKYLVAAEEWPAGLDKLSLQATCNVPNAVWAVVNNGPGTGYTGNAYTLIDLKHGLQLGDTTGYPQFAGDPNVPKEMPLHVVHEYDRRGKWQQEATITPTVCRLKNTATGKFLYAPNDMSPSLGSGGSANLDSTQRPDVWWLEEVSEGHFTVARLPISAKGQTIGWQVDLASKPANGNFGGVKTEDVVSVLYDALKKWIDAFNQFGLKLSLSPAQPPDEGAPTAEFSGGPNIKFRWGDVSSDAGSVSIGGTGGFWNNRESSVVLTLSKTQMWYVLPRGAWAKLISLSALDLRSAAAHELGHVFGLDHVTNDKSVMQTTLLTGDIWTKEGDKIFNYDTWRLRARYGDLFYGGSSLFSVYDFQDLSGFVAKLRTVQDPISAYLWNQFSASTQRVLTRATSTPEQQKLALVQALNNILKGVLIFETVRFAGVKLSAETLELKLRHSENPQGTDLIRLNRLLLEDAYPLEIAKSDLFFSKSSA